MLDDWSASQSEWEVRRSFGGGAWTVAQVQPPRREAYRLIAAVQYPGTAGGCGRLG